jgi:oxygen-independent coproporphyrinogen-3 oxidase
MPTEFLSQLLDAVPSPRLTERTLECAPGTLTREKVETWVRLGINRVSLGVQSFDEAELRHTGRRHRADTVQSDVELLHRSGIENINVDLIAGLPYQSRESWARSLEWVEQLSVPHVSVYLFEIDEDSHLGQEILLGGQRFSAGFLPSDDLAAELYQTAVDRLAAAGVARYEISNFARPGFESRHNLKYWTREPYVGFGLDAHSFDGTMRWSNPDDLPTYLAGEGASPQREPANGTEERFFVGLRLTEGIEPRPEDWVRFADPIRKWTELGMLERCGDRLRLSGPGVLVSNEILQEFLDDN